MPIGKGREKYDENLPAEPVSVTAYTGDAIANIGALNFADIASFTPGFAAVNAASNGSALAFSFRGQIQNDVLATLEPSIGTYVDGVYGTVEGKLGTLNQMGEMPQQFYCWSIQFGVC